MGLSWLSVEEKKNVEAALPAISSGEVAPEPDGSRGVLARGEATVATGEEGIRGLADALGSKPRAEPKDDDEERPIPKRQKKAAREDKEKPEGTGRLQEVLQERTAAAPELSALKMPRGKKESDKKKKKKKREAKAKKRTQRSGDSSSSSSSNSGSSEGSVFRLAALPQGVEKLQRLHQERLGTLANLTLRRFNELLNRSVGGGIGRISLGSSTDSSSLSDTDLPSEEPGAKPRFEELAGTPDPSGHGGSHGLERHASSLGHSPPKDEGNRGVRGPRKLDAGDDAGAGASGRRTESLVQTGIESSTARGKVREQDAAGSMEPTEKNMGGRHRRRGASKQRDEGRRRKRRHSAQQRGQGPEGQRKRQKGKAMVEAEQVNSGVWPKVRSLVNPELDASSLAGLEKVCSSEEVCAIWECLRLAFPTKQVWEEVEKQFAKSLILMNGLPDDLVIKEIGRAWKFPEQEADPAYNRHVMGSLGLPAIPLDAVPGEVEGNLWGTHRGVEIRLLPSNFSGLNGVFVGKGRRDQPDSIFTKERLPTLRTNVVKDMLTGRRLYVAAGNESWAKELIDKLELEGGTILEMGTWTKGLRKLFSKPLTLKLAGVMLKTMLLHRLGHLGNFTRSFLCCALETFQKSAVELLPMALPPGTAEESKLIELLTGYRCC